MRKQVRKLRHWKQRFNKNAEFIWRRFTPYAGKEYKAGDPIPKTLQDNPTKLRRFWESNRIELAEFEEPNVLTGQVGAPKHSAPYVVGPSGTILGSSTLEAVYEIFGEIVQLGDIVLLAFEGSCLDVESWNALDDNIREGLIAQALDWMQDEGTEDGEEPGDDEGSGDDIKVEPGSGSWFKVTTADGKEHKVNGKKKLDALLAELRARDVGGRFVGDDETTANTDEAWKDGGAPSVEDDFLR